jgi:hypothetical protein
MQILTPQLWLANDFRNARQCWRFSRANQDWQQAALRVALPPLPTGARFGAMMAHIPLQMTG